MNDETNKIKALGEKMMQGFSVPNSQRDESFSMPSFNIQTKESTNMFGVMGKGMGMGLASEDDSNKLREMGKKMMGL